MNEIKQKKTYGTYKKRINIAFFLYTLYILFCFASILVVGVSVPRDIAGVAGCASFAAAFVFFIAGSAIFVFCIAPRLKKAQAREDFKRGDFTVYSSVAETEVLEQEYHSAQYIFTASPFDEDESVILPDRQALEQYISQFANEKLISRRIFENGVKESHFFVGWFFDGYTKTRAEKRKNGDKVYVDFYELHRAEFNEKGITVGDKFYGYDTDTQAEVTARFGHETDFFVSVRVLILLGADGVLSFEASSRIAAIINRFGIKVANREVFDYICADPLKAYEQTALQLVLKKLK